MSFFEIGNIDLWLLTGVLWTIFWAIYQAIPHDYEKHEERIRNLEFSEAKYRNLREIKKLFKFLQ
jgi:hypothetical protein